jgi:hypothetical protein
MPPAAHHPNPSSLSVRADNATLHVVNCSLSSTQVSYVKTVRRIFQNILLHWNDPYLHVIHPDMTKKAPKTEWWWYTYCIWCGPNYCLVQDDHVTEFYHYIWFPGNITIEIWLKIVSIWLYVFHILGLFAALRNAHYKHFVRPSVCTHEATRWTLKKFWWNMILG